MVYLHIVDTISSIYFLYFMFFYPFYNSMFFFTIFYNFVKKTYEIYLFTSKYCLNCIVTGIDLRLFLSKTLLHNSL